MSPGYALYSCFSSNGSMGLPGVARSHEGHRYGRAEPILPTGGKAEDHDLGYFWAKALSLRICFSLRRSDM